MIFEDVVLIDTDGDRFVVKTGESTLHPRFVVIASGTRPRKIASMEISGHLSEESPMSDGYTYRVERH